MSVQDKPRQQVIPESMQRMYDAFHFAPATRVGDMIWVSGQVGIDADVVELVPPGGRRTEPILSLAPSAADSLSLRTAGSGHQPSGSLSYEETTQPNALERRE